MHRHRQWTGPALVLFAAAVTSAAAGIVHARSGTPTATPAAPAPALAPAHAPTPANLAASSIKLRVATFNLHDVRTTDLLTPDQPRLKRLAAAIQEVRPTIILLNEIAYDMAGAPGYDALVARANDAGERTLPAPGQNAQRFADLYLATPQGEGLPAIRYRAFMAPTNTGMPSGFDLDNDGKVVTEFPPPPPPAPGTPDGEPGPDSKEGRAFGGDCWGFGTFPGQYAMGLLVDERLLIDAANVRTFRLLPWDYVDGAFMPKNADGTHWYSDEERQYMRLSSKSHWDVPVKLPNGATVHLLCSHPTPPAFDGPEMRNQKRNHDEIRFWGDYLDGAGYIVDDANKQGGLTRNAHFVILGDLNADPDEGNSFKNPIANVLFTNSRINREFVPRATRELPELDSDDTSDFKLRVDYVLPSKTMEVLAGAIERGPAPGPAPEPVRTPAVPAVSAHAPADWPSDHFLVWVDVLIPAPESR